MIRWNRMPIACLFPGTDVTNVGVRDGERSS
jgi:hypothetical protein